VPMLDAGRRDAGPPPVRDAFVTPDAGPETTPPASGCGCAIPSRTTEAPVLLLALAALAAIRRGRER
jgi:MYXO-CTERM domain-containing protein